MTSVKPKKAGATEEDRQNILRQMKVRTKLKTDMSWIQRQSSEEETDGVSSPISPQLKSLEGRKSLWSPTPDSKPDRNSGSFTAKDVYMSSATSPVQSGSRNSGSFTAKEVVIRSPASPVQSSSSRQFSYSSTENTTSPSAASKPPPSPSATASKPSHSYIIRGQTLNAVSQVKSPPSYNGYQKSTVQGRTNSLPRIQTATGFKMSTEEYKKLAPYNVRNKSVDLSDDETPFIPEEQAKRTEQASSILKNTASKERSYVISAARRNSGSGTQEAATPFVAKRVEIQEEMSPERKSQSLPKSLATYLYEDSNRFENSWKETQSGQTQPQPQTTPPSGSNAISKPSAEKESAATTNVVNTKAESAPERSSSPRLSSYTVNTTINGRSSPVKPEAGRITVVRAESKDISKPPAEKESSTATNIRTTRTERVEVTENTGVTLPQSLASYLYEDASRFENNWKSNQASPPTLVTTSPRVSDRPESPKLIPRSTEKRVTPIKPEPAKITVLREESENANAPKPASYKDDTESISATMQTGPGKITVLKEEESHDSDRGSPRVTTQGSSTTTTTTRRTVETRVESNKESSDLPKLVSCSILTEEPAPIMQTGPGKITLITEDGIPDRTSSNATSRTTVTTETRSQSTPPKPVPRMETRPKDPASDLQGDLISWSDLDDSDNRTTSNANNGNVRITIETLSERPGTPETERSSSPRLPKEKPTAAPKPVPRQNINRDSEKVASDAPLVVISPELHSNRVPQPPTPASISALNETRYRVPEFLDDPQPSPRSNLTTENRNVRIKIETLSETEVDGSASDKVPSDASLIVSSPELHSNRAPQPPTAASVSALNETRYRVPEFLDDPQPSPRSNLTTSNPENGNVRITIETLSERPGTPDTERSSSPRPSPRSRDTSTTVTETRYRVPETLEDTMLKANPARSGSRTTVTTTRSTDPVYTEYLEDRDARSTRTVSSSREKITTTTTVETRYDHASSRESSQYEPESPSNKGVLFVKEYVNTSESLKSPTSAGNGADLSGDSERLYSANSSYLYNSAPRRSDEGPCTYCGREIKDCAKIILEHLNIYCHEYCFKCGICNKPMGDLIACLFIHRDVVHCESCYEKLF